MKTKLIIATLFAGLSLALAEPQQDPVVGVGLSLTEVPEGVKIVQVLPKSPADRAGLVPGIIVNKVDGTVVRKEHLVKVVEKIRGTPGTKVELELIDLAKQETNTVELTREKIALLPEVRTKRSR